MRKLKLFFACLLMAVLSIGQVWGAEETVTLSNGSFDTDHISWSAACGNIIIQQIKGSSSTAVNSSYISAPRVYKGHVLSFVAATGYKINSIEITVSGTYYGNSMTAGTVYSSNTVTDNTTDVARTWTSTSGGKHVVSAVSSDGLSAIYIQNVASSTNTQLRFTGLKITYTSTSSTPSVSVTPASWNFGTVHASATASKVFSVSGSNLTAGDLTLTVPAGFSVSPSSIAVDGTLEATEVTVSKNTSAEDDYAGDLSISGGGLASAKTVALTMTVDADPAPTGTFKLFSGDLTEGDYVITYSAKALVNSVTGTTGRMGFAAISLTDGKIVNPETTIIWHIAPVSETSHWTIFNAAVNKYLAGTGVANKIQLLAEGADNKEKWTVSGSSTYDFTNVANTTASVNAILRYNNSNAATNSTWACYGSGTGGALTLYKLDDGKPDAPTFSPAGGSFIGEQDVTLSAAGADEIRYTLDGSAPTSTSTLYTAAIHVSSTTTIKAIAIKAGAASNPASATYTITVPYTNIPAIFAAATGTSTPVYITFDGWKISYVKGGQAYLTDGTNGLIIYQSGHGFEVGNELSGTVSCNLVLYNGAAELTGLTSTTTGLTVSEGEMSAAVVKTIDQLGAVNTGALVTIQNVTYDGTDLVDDNSNKIKAHNSLYSELALTSGSKYNITGIASYHNAMQILPRSAADIEEISTKYTVTYNANPDNGTLTIKNGDDVVTSGSKVNENTVLTIIATPDEGYNLSGVTVNGSAYTETTLELTEDVTIAATFVENQNPDATLTLSVQGSTSTFPGSHKVNDVVTLPASAPACEGNVFVGWSEVEISTPGAKPTTQYYDKGTSYTLSAETQTLYAVYAAVATPESYQKLASDEFETTATYVIGAEQSSTVSTMWYFSSYSNTNVNINWGEMTNDPATVAPIRFTLSGTASALVAQDAAGNYLAGLNTGKFKMSSTSTTITLSDAGIIGSTNSYVLRHNYNGGNGGLRWYNATTGTAAYFYKVVAPTYNNYSTTCYEPITAPTFDVAGGSYTSEQLVLIDNYDDDYIYVYTLDGTEPTADSNLDPEGTAALYDKDNGIEINASCTLKARAYDLYGNYSDVTSAEYTINLPISLAEFLTQKPNESKYVDLTGAVIWGQTADLIFVQQGEAAIALYKKNHGKTEWTYGKKISGIVTASKYSVYQAKPEMNISSFGEATVADAEESDYPDPLVVNADNSETLMVVDNAFRLIQMENVNFGTDEYNYVTVTFAGTEITNYFEDELNVMTGKVMPLSETSCSVKGILYPWYESNTSYDYDQIAPFALSNISTNGAKAPLPALVGQAGGNDEASAQEVPSGETIELTASEGTNSTYKIGEGAAIVVSTSGTNVEITGDDDDIIVVTVNSTRDFYADNSKAYYYKINNTIETYNITKQAALNGSFLVKNEDASAEITSAAENDIVTLVANPDENYHWVSWSVYETETPANVITVTNNQFTMPATAVTVTATFAEDPYAMVAYAKGEESATGDVPAAVKVYVGQKLGNDVAWAAANTFKFAHHTFAGWVKGATTYKLSDQYTVTEEDHAAGTITFTATWTENSPWAGVFTSNVGALVGGGEYFEPNSYVEIEDVTYDAQKVGNSSTKSGTVTITVPAGASALHFHVFGWNSISSPMKISMSGVTNASQTEFDVEACEAGKNTGTYIFETADPEAYHQYVSFDEVNTPTEITFSYVSGDKRFIMFGVNVEVYTRNVSGNYGTLCLPLGGTIENATLFELAGKDDDFLYIDETGSNVVEAGRPYIFLPSAAQIKVTYNTYTYTEAGTHNSLVGTYEALSSASTTSSVLWHNYVIANNKYVYVDDDRVTLPANRAYILSSIGAPNAAPAHGCRRVALGGDQVATGIDALNAAEAPVKMIIDGQLFIIRGEKMYNANGQLVK